MDPEFFLPKYWPPPHRRTSSIPFSIATPFSPPSGPSHWLFQGPPAESKLLAASLTNDTKVHIRAVALNRQRESRPANEYPLYVTAAPPPPDGLAAMPGAGRVHLTWGEVLGASAYKLYRRSPGEVEFREIFHGLAHEFTDPIDCRPAFSEPGLKAAALRHADAPIVHQYAVAAVNGNGEGARSLPVDTDPRAWSNWQPAADLRFKRRSGFWLPPYVRESDVPPASYPIQEP